MLEKTHITNKKKVVPCGLNWLFFYFFCAYFTMQNHHFSSAIKHFGLDQNTCFLNHGAFGATPLSILQKQTDLRMRMEAQPLRFFVRELEDLIWQSKTDLARFVGTQPENLVFQQNTTQGVNTIMHSLKPASGDEWLITNFNYGSCINTFKHYAQQHGVVCNTAQIPFPLTSEDEVLDAIRAAITPRTKLALIDYITSATGVILPIQRIIDLLHSYGIEVLVDAAHAPGMVNLDLDAMGADYFVGNLHKWVFAPKGAALLYVRPKKQAKIKPLQFSHYHDKRISTPQHWSDQFTMLGTTDYTAYLCVSDGIAFPEAHLGMTWQELRTKNHDFTLKMREKIQNALHLSPVAPDNMIGSLATFILNKDAEPPRYNYNHTEGLGDTLFHDFGIEIPVFYLKNGTERVFRIACQCYNDESQYDYFIESMQKLGF
jgi:isopenicillin-N epimerase